MDVSATDQLTSEIAYSVGVIVAVKSIVLPTFTEAVFGAMLIEGVEETVTVQVAETSPYVAVTFAVPSATPLTTPLSETVATLVLFDVQVRSSFVIQLLGVIVAVIVAFSFVATAVSVS